MNQNNVLVVKKETTIPREEECPTCHGSKAKPGTKATTCKMCNGTGTVTQSVKTILRTNANN